MNLQSILLVYLSLSTKGDKCIDDNEDKEVNKDSKGAKPGFAKIYRKESRPDGYHQAAPPDLKRPAQLQ